jgi:malonyl-CoA O-methyltransferase
MVRGVFVTGTDTGVGKTVVSAALVQRYRGQLPIRYWKPIQTGIEQDDDTAEVRRLSKCRPEEIRATGIRLERPVSPHLAARLAGVTIDIEALAEDLAAEPPDTRWIVEGAGGVLVPVSQTDLMVDLMILLALPVVIVARSTLGTINHTLLTIEALRARGLRPAGVVLVGPANPENRGAIEHHGRVTVVGDMPAFTPLTPAALAAWSASALDPDGRILGLMR